VELGSNDLYILNKKADMEIFFFQMRTNLYRLMMSSDEGRNFGFIDGVNLSTVSRMSRVTITFAFHGMKFE